MGGTLLKESWEIASAREQERRAASEYRNAVDKRIGKDAGIVQW